MAFYESTSHPQIKRYTDKRSGDTRYLVRYRTDANRLTMKRGLRTMRDAKAFLSEQESAKAAGSFVAQSSGRRLIGDLAQPWLEHKRAVRTRGYSRTLDTAWRLHVGPRWADAAVADVAPSAVRAWVNELAAAGKSATVVARAHGVLAGILDAAVEDRLIVRNPARGVGLPRRRGGERRYLTAEEVEALAGVVPERYRVLVLLLCWTGLRWGEAVALRVRDVNLLRRRLLVQRAAAKIPGGWEVTDTKGHRSRSVPLPASLLAELEQHIVALPGKGPERLLFPPARSKEGFLYPPRKAAVRPDRPGKVRIDWLEAGLAEIGAAYVSPHDLRHTAASLAVSAGANVKALQRMLGHESASMTLDTYADLFDEDLDLVGERLDALRVELSTDLSTKSPDLARTRHISP